MSKIDEILDGLNDGGDFDVEWSERSGNRVILIYSGGMQIVVEATLRRLVYAPSSPEEGGD